jgi:hypothetical protein
MVQNGILGERSVHFARRRYSSRFSWNDAAKIVVGLLQRKEST